MTMHQNARFPSLAPSTHCDSTYGPFPMRTYTLFLPLRCLLRIPVYKFNENKERGRDHGSTATKLNKPKTFSFQSESESPSDFGCPVVAWILTQLNHK